MVRRKHDPENPPRAEFVDLGGAQSQRLPHRIQGKVPALLRQGKGVAMARICAHFPSSGTYWCAYFVITGLDVRDGLQVT